jgi:hypothetical protein
MERATIVCSSAVIVARRPTGLWTGSKVLIPSQTRMRLVPFSKLLISTVTQDMIRKETLSANAQYLATEGAAVT